MEDVFWMKYLFEFLGTALLILLGDGVVASTLLHQSKGWNGGWVVITLGWGFAVMCGAFVAAPYSGAHLNPALSIALALTGDFSWSDLWGYCIAQFAGAFLGAVLVYVFYKDHYDVTADAGVKLATFCTMPAILNKRRNLFCEVVGTFVLVFVILCLAVEGNVSEIGLGSIGLFPVTFLIMAIGMSLGGTTGYAINPARDLSPRLAHALLPIRGKGKSGWGYAWIPILGPLIGACLAAGCYLLIF